ncbi:MAG: acylhydrolase [Clostridiales bacterium]|nr:acylhydrolase [Clostridiales bacterium]
MRILCYGDSNTWGYIPNGKHERYPEDIRYPMVLQKLLGNDYEIIEEGLCSRTIANQDPKHSGDEYIAKRHFENCFKSHMPVDLLILFLGSNDMKDYFTFNAFDAALALDELIIGKIKQISPNTKIIIVIPKEIENSNFEGFENAKIKSKDFEKAYEYLAKLNNCQFVPNNILDVGQDGLHLTKDAHLSLANALYNLIINSI